MERVGEIHPSCKQPFLFKWKKQQEIHSATGTDSHKRLLRLTSLLWLWETSFHNDKINSIDFFILWLINPCWLPLQFFWKRQTLNFAKHKQGRTEGETPVGAPNTHRQWSLFIYQLSFRGVIWQSFDRLFGFLYWFGSWLLGRSAMADFYVEWTRLSTGNLNFDSLQENFILYV